MALFRFIRKDVMPMEYDGFQMSVRICTHCNRLIEKCNYQRAMRGFGLNTIADIWVRDEDVPPCTSSTSYGK